MMISKTGRMTMAAALGLLVLLGGIWALGRKPAADAFAACGGGSVAGGGAIGGPFQLTDETGAPVTDAEVLAKPSLVYFGYTFCPDVCPTDIARNVAAVDILEEQGIEVTPVFISVDPRRDTPEVLTEWTDYFHPRLVGLTGTDAQIRDVAKAYKTYYRVPENPVDDTYLVDHMTQTFLMLPGTGFADFFGSADDPDTVADRTACYIDAAARTN